MRFFNLLRTRSERRLRHTPPFVRRYRLRSLRFLQREAARRRAIYLLPNAFTSAALFCGFFAIIQAIHGRFEAAAIAILAAIVLDGMDGRVARLTKTQSSFGEMYDSLADMVSFGTAPAVLLYEWGLKGLGRWGWLAAFAYCAGTALRLARFNTRLGKVDPRYFEGLPCPAAAALLATFIWLIGAMGRPVQWGHWAACALTLFAAVSMVSSLSFYSGKTLDIKSRVSFGVIPILVFSLALVSANPPLLLFGFFAAYAVSGYLLWFWRRVAKLLAKRKVT